jgi:hypothetical protein
MMGRPSMTRTLCFAGPLLAALTAGAIANATPSFPAMVQQFVGAPSPPACTICHDNPSGGLGTVTTTFGMYLRSRGLVAFDESSLRTALMADAAEQHVSNGEGIPDIQALREGLDPNNPGGAAGDPSGSPPPPQYGCGATVSPNRERAGNGGAAAFVLVLVAAIARRRRPGAGPRPA